MAEPAASEPPPQKFSRYRSVRRAQAAHQTADVQCTPTVPAVPAVPAVPKVASMPPAPPMHAQNEAPVSRSMSRYHRRPTTSHPATARAPPLRSATVDLPQPPAAPPVSSSRIRALSSPHAQPADDAEPQVPNASCSRPEPASTAATSGRRPSRTARDEAKQLMQDEAERHRRMKEKIEAEKHAKLKAEQAELERQEQQQRKEQEEAGRLKLQQEAEEAARLQRAKEEKERGKRLQKVESANHMQQRVEAERQARVDEASRQVPSSPVSPPKTGGRFGLFGRRKESSAASQDSPPPYGSRSPPASHDKREMDTIRPGGGGAVLGIDAPISAVNAGDRRVSILCNKKTFLLPVTPETTAQDLLRSASVCMTESINLHTDILVENFVKVSVKRPLRLYEHVRDVMNSWDNDTQNDLEIVNAHYYDYDRQALLASEVSSKKPEGMGCYIHYSSRPGKWSKKYVLLRSDGQLVMAKTETAKEQENICHLSDFDIYKPTERKLGKIKPPKKACYAVKSQQKSNIFSDESRYVHFFCTNDTATAVRFYASIQGWRSWHLRHVMGEGEKKSAPTQDNKPVNGLLAKTKALGALDQSTGSSHTRNVSESSFYQLGSFKPLLDLDAFGKNLDHSIQSASLGESPIKMDTQAMHARKMSTRVKAPPPVAYSRTGGLVDEIPDAPIEKPGTLAQDVTRPEEEPFAATGLLGRTYSQRQKAVQEREKKANGPFTEGPSLVGNIDYMASMAQNEGGLSRGLSTRSSHKRTSSDIQRSMSTRVKPRPLVDLTPQYREPPQHRNKGKGYVPDNGAGPLIDNATSLDEAIKVPPSTDWRSRPVTARPHGTYGTGGYERTRSLKGRGEGLAAYTVNIHNAVPDDDRNAFTGGGLLARAGFSQGGHGVGRGVMNGSKARGPLLNMNEDSKFASGSLLAGVERKQGACGPSIDRDRRQSVDLG